MSEERVLLEAEFLPVVRKYQSAMTTLGLSIPFVIIGLLLAPLTFGTTLLVALAAPVVIWFFASKYYAVYFGRLSCVLTDRKLNIRKGVLFKTEQSVPLDKITDMQMTQGPVMRHFGVETMRVETAGGMSTAGAALVGMTGIVDSREFRAAVLRQRDLVVGTAAGVPAPAPVAETQAAAVGDQAVLSEIRDALLRIEDRLADRSV